MKNSPTPVLRLRPDRAVNRGRLSYRVSGNRARLPSCAWPGPVIPSWRGGLIGAFFVTNVGRMPHGFGDFLALRLTVKNLLFCWHLPWPGELSARSAGFTGGSGSGVAAMRQSGSCGFRDWWRDCPGVCCHQRHRGVPGSYRHQLARVGTRSRCCWSADSSTIVTDIDADARRNVLILGSGPRAILLGHELNRNVSGNRIVGYLDADSSSGGEELGDLTSGGSRIWSGWF